MDARDLSVSAALAALSVSVAAALGLLLRGDRWIVPLVAIALLPHVVGAVARALRRSQVVELGASVGLLLVGVFVIAGPDPSDVLHALDRGVDLLFVGTPPVPATDGAIAVAAVLVWVAASIADEAALRYDGSVGAVVPGALILVAIAPTEVGPDLWGPVAAFAGATALVLVLQHRRLLDRQRTWIGSTPDRRETLRLVGAGALVAAIVIGIGVGGAAALLESDRPLLDVGDLLSGDERATTYETKVAPLLNVGDELRQPEVTTLFSVQADEPAYWRTVALDEYTSADGGQWTLQADGDEVSDSLDDDVPRDALVQRFEIGPQLTERWIPAAYRAVEVKGADLGLVVPDSATLVTDRPTIGGARYTVRSALPPTAAEIDREAAAAEVPEDVRQYTELPDDIPSIVVETAQAVAGDQPDPVAKAQALRDFFRDPSFVYDPTVTLADDTAAVETFLRDRRGFCVQFATAYALMARALGIPARIGVGYTPGTFDEATGRWVVTNQDAHAWPELYFTGTGWAVPFDPTPPDESAPGGSDLPGEVEPAPPPPPDPTQPETPPTSAPVTVPPTAAPPDSTPAPPTPSDGGGSVQIDAGGSSDNSSLLRLVALVVLLLLVVLSPFAAVLFAKHRRRARRRAAEDPVEAVAGAWREALDLLADHRVTWSGADTPLETAAHVARVTNDDTWPPLSSLATTYSSACYGATPPSDEGVDAAWHDVDDLREALERPLNPIAVLRARLSLISFRRERATATDRDAERDRERTRTAERV